MRFADAYANFCGDSGLEPEDIQRQGQTTSLDSMLSITSVLSKERPTKRDYVTVRRYYQLPDDKHPAGIYGVLIENTPIIATWLPYAHNRIPFVPVRCRCKPGELYPRSTVDELLPVANAIDDHFSNIHARAQQSVLIKVLTPSGSGFELTDEPGIAQYDHRPGVPEPRAFTHGDAPQETFQVIERLFLLADEISFATEVLRGASPPNVKSANHAALLEERSVVPLRLMLEDYNDSLTSLGQLVVDTIGLFYDDGRVVQVFGEQGQTELRAYRTEHADSSIDVKLENTQDVFRSLSSRRDQITEALKAGVLDHPLAMKLSEFATDKMLRAARIMHESAAQAENERARRGEPTGEPHLFEDHTVHLETHFPVLNELRMTLGADSPPAQQLEAHMWQTQDMQSMEQGRQQMLMLQANQAFGQANAAAPEQQPEGAVEAAEGAGLIPEELSPLGAQESLQRANEATPPPPGP